MTGPIVLVGLMATGKTSVGQALANELGVVFHDSDALIEARTGHTVAQIFEECGEPAFRALETEALALALDADPPGVVAAAGGVVLSADDRARLKAAGGTVVWLRADPALLASRVRPGDHRPLLKDDPAGTLRRMAEQRGPLYAEVADRIVDIAGKTVEELVREVRA